MLKIYAFIPARIGSQRIKKKNIINFRGKPLICWTVEAAIKSRVFHKILVSADDKIIYDKLSNYINKITKLSRPKNLSKSTSKIDTLLLYYIKKKIIKKNSIIVLLQPTSPLRNKLHIKKVINYFIKKKLNTLISVSNLRNKFPIHQIERVLNNQKNSNKKIYLNGAIYINTYENLIKYKKIKNLETYFYKMENNMSLDIDTFADIRKFKKIN